MSEYLARTSFAERLRPDVTPAMGFQSYEMLAGDSEHRKAQERLFMDGEIRNPTFDYPKIDPEVLKASIETLNGILIRVGLWLIL